MLPEDKDNEFLSITESIPKRDNTGTGIDILVMYFDGKTYKSVIFYEGTEVKR